jgi:hypothetical protein
LDFTPSTFKFIKDQFGELIIERKEKSWLDSSLILTKEEVMILPQMIESKYGSLLYRATRDGFEASSFHSKCDGKAKTITIIKTQDNYVFGGYTDASWDSTSYWKTDAASYIYSLRRNGVSNLSKHKILKSDHAICCVSSNGPTFGRGYDIGIADRSDVNKGNFTNTLVGNSYSISSNTYLAGTYNNWLTNEIEVYHIL